VVIELITKAGEGAEEGARAGRGRTGEDGRFCLDDRRTDQRARAIVSVEVGQGAQPGRCTDLDQRERLRMRVAHRAGSFVWVGRVSMTREETVTYYRTFF
jgi:hypothetical protein